MIRPIDYSPLLPKKRIVPGLIWKVLPSYEATRLVIEARLPDERMVNALVLELELEHNPIRSLEVPLSWTDRLITVHEGMAFWQGLADEGMPDPLGLTGIDLTTGSLTWTDDQSYLIRTGPEILITRNSEFPSQVQFVDARSGRVRVQMAQDQVPEQELDRYDQNRHSVLSFPSHIVPLSSGYQEIATRFQQILSQQIEGPVSTLKVGEVEIFHIYHKEADQVTSKLILFRKGDDALILDSGAYPSGYTVDPYFLYRNWLIWIEHPSTIGILNLKP